MRATVRLAIRLKWVGFGCALALLAFRIAPAQDEDLGSKAQAIFAESCYAWHGPGQRWGGLRLDTGAARVVVAGNSSDSLLWKRVTGSGGKPRMPMGGAPLSNAKIALLARWIDGGVRLRAPRKHWAFVPPVRPAIPKIRDAGAVRNAVDAFVLARLDSEGLKP